MTKSARAPGSHIFHCPFSLRLQKVIRFVFERYLWATVKAFLTDTLLSGQLYKRLRSQIPVLLKSHTNSIFVNFRNRPAPVMDTFFASRGCPLTRASNLHRACGKLSIQLCRSCSYGLSWLVAENNKIAFQLFQYFLGSGLGTIGDFSS